jgi:hypothetical protein
MFKILGRTAGKLVDIAVEGDLTPRDFVELRRQLDPLIEEHRKLRLLFDLRRLRNFEGDALWDDSSFPPHESVERVALVAPSRHAERARATFALGAKELQAFDVDRAEDAWLWLTGLESD